MNKEVKKLILKNFRGFKGEYEFNLDADLILLSGKNGVGKSSIIYALDRMLNGYSKDGMLNKIQNILHTETNEGNILVQFDNDTRECSFNKKENSFTKSQDDKYSFLYELSSVFYQEYLEDVGAEDIIKIMAGDWLSIKITKYLNELNTKVIPELKQKYFPSIVNIEERRKEFFNKWKNLIEELKKHNNYQDIKQNFAFDNKGIPKHFEKQFINFAIYIKEKHNIPSEENLNQNSDFVEILKYLREVIEKTNKKEEKDNNQTTNSHNLLKYSGFSIINKDINPENIKNNELHILSKEKINELKNKVNKLIKQKDNLEKELEKLEKSLSVWEISGKNDFEEVLSDLAIYMSQLSKIKEENLYYPTKVLLWLGKVKDTIDTVYSDFVEWKEKTKKIRDAHKQKIEYIRNQIKILNDELEFNDFLIPNPDLLNKIKQKLQNEEIFIFQNDLLNEIVSDRDNLPIQIIWSQMINLLNEQIEKELKYKEEINVYENQKLNFNKKRKIIEDIEKIVKNEKNKNGILKSFMQELPDNYLNNLTHTLNNILRFFHFPEEFLDLTIKNIGTKKTPKYSIVSESGNKLNFSDLSTGQKSQIAIGWVIGLNYLLRDKIPHNVIMFDDITTSLDLSQLIPASILFRKMAYSNVNNRQVIISSHHEDLTNRFIDFLMPPPEKTMKIIYFEEWSFSDGPKYIEYLVKGKDLQEKDIKFFYTKKLNELKSYLGG